MEARSRERSSDGECTSEPVSGRGGGSTCRSESPAAPQDCELPRLKFLGHTGFIYQWRNTSVLLNPWFRAAHHTSWFPFPNNRFLERDYVLGATFGFVYISRSLEVP